jgi:hypothetical protein
MKHKGPIITLLAGLLVAGVLFVLNVDLSNDAARNAAARNAAVNATATTSASPPTAGPSAKAPGTQPSATKAPAADDKSTYAGTVDGGAAGLAIAINNGKALAYVCDGKRVEAWLEGTAQNGELTLSGKKGSLTATYGNGAATGTVKAGTKTWHFTIKLATAPSGLYRTAANVRTKLDASWAVVPRGDGLQGVQQYGLKTGPNGEVGTAPEFDTKTNAVNDGDTKITVESPDPATTTVD